MNRLSSLLLAVVLAAPVARATPTVVLDGPQVPLAGTPEQVARLAVARVGAQLGLESSPTTLAVESSHALPQGGWVVRLQQELNGVPVTNGIVTVRLDEARRVVRVVSGAKRVEAVETTPRISGAEALGRARAALGTPVPTEAAGRGRVVVTPGGTLAWEVWPATLLPHVKPVVVVDAVTGEVLSVRDAVVHAGRADVFASGATARAARQRDGSFDGSGIIDVELSTLLSTAPGAHLTSADIVARNCCPNANCDGTSPPPMATGTFRTGFGVIPYEIAMCDERPRAAADENGDFRFPPPREPSPGVAVPFESDGDEFSEVNAFHAADDAFSYLRGLDAAFALRREARPLEVVSNFLLPDYNEIAGNPNQILADGKIRIEGLMRLGNAAYVPAGAGGQLGVPGFDRAHDSILVFQGGHADFAYDRDVVVHEFGHGVVAATAGLIDYAADDQGVLDAPGAMNEGFADFLAAARANQPEIGQYVGPYETTGEGTLRTLENDFSCPSVLWGEVHQDSQHFSAALWDARKALATTDADRTAFDRAVLASLRQIVPDSTFDAAAAVLAGEVETAFGASAKATIEAAFTDRNVTGCERVVDLGDSDTKGPYYLAPASRMRGWTPFAPGPMQFRLSPPAGAKRIVVTALLEQGGFGGGLIPGTGGGQDVRPLGFLRPDERIHFTYGRTVTSDALAQVEFDGGDSASWNIEPACGEVSYFVALGNPGTSDQLTVREVSVRYEIDRAKAKECAPVSVPDAGTAGPPDAGSALVAGGGGGIAGGCGCTAGSLSLLPLLVVVARLRRRRA